MDDGSYSYDSESISGTEKYTRYATELDGPVTAFKDRLVIYQICTVNSVLSNISTSARASNISIPESTLNDYLHSHVHTNLSGPMSVGMRLTASSGTSNDDLTKSIEVQADGETVTASGDLNFSGTFDYRGNPTFYLSVYDFSIPW